MYIDIHIVSVGQLRNVLRSAEGNNQIFASNNDIRVV